jgi:hypothetical protein
MLANLYAGRIAYVGERLQHLSAHELQALYEGLGALLASW